MPVKRYLVERIEQALRAWEDALFLQEMGVIAQCQGRVDRSVHPIIWNWSQFRRYLIEASDNLFDADRFSMDTSPSATQSRLYNQFLLEECTFEAYALQAWMTESRRVYGLDSELSHLLINTSLSRLRWADIRLPFNAFAITPEEPIMLGDVGIDCIIVRQITQPGEVAKPEDQIVISCFKSSLASFPKLPSLTKQKLHAMVRRRDWPGISKILMKRYQMVQGMNFDSVHLHTPDPLARINDSADLTMEEYTEIPPNTKLDEQRRALDQIYRLVGSFCLYLQNLPPGSPHVTSEKVKRSKGDDPKAIIWEADVATVTNSYVLSDEEREWLKKSTSRQRYELSAHWRSGYWHRPPGFGNDPAAKKTEWTRPTLVRKDRLPPETKPGGTRQMRKHQRLKS